MMELYAIDVFVDLLRRYGDASPMDEYAFSDERVMWIGSSRPLTVIYGGIS
jgi:hypothetical protein